MSEDTRNESSPVAGPAVLRGADSRYAVRRLATQCVHAGEREVVETGYRGSNTPVHYSTTFTYDSMQTLDDVLQRKRAGYVYSRYGTPTNSALERALATLEGADAALSCSSGMAACHLALLGAGVKCGDLVLASSDIYGATYQLIHTLLPRLGLRGVMADFTDLAALEQIMQNATPRVIFFEAVTNPLIRVLDVPRIVDLAHRYGATVIVDNTFTTPLLLRPLEYGVDWVVHSVTKFLAGHGDVLAGAVLCQHDDFDYLYTMLLQVGCSLGPQEAYMALRGLKTFPLRFERQCDNALEIARFLEGHTAIERVYYPGLGSHPQHDLARELLRGGRFGAMVGFDLKHADKVSAFRVLDALEIILPATTLGDVYSTMMYPAHSSHASLSDEELSRVGISRGLLRLSAGIEDVDDLKEDLDQALLHM
jgi:cystathionine beta-lyase/cystathionine gamma-synthase